MDNFTSTVAVLSPAVEGQKPLSSFYAVGELVSAEVEACNASNSQLSVEVGTFFEEIHFNDGPGGKVNKVGLSDGQKVIILYII